MKKTPMMMLLVMQVIIVPVFAQTSQFHKGPAIEKFGMIADVKGAEKLPENTNFKVSFDVDKQAEIGQLNRSINSAARFLNMHVAAGIDVANIKLAMVIHGGAVKDMINNSHYQSLEDNKSNAINSNAALIQELQKLGVTFTVCGQSAAYYGVKKIDLLPGVTLSLSAMTAHALLQNEGYTLNPF